MNDPRASWLLLLSLSVAALAADKDPGWRKIRLRDWGGVGENYRLSALETMWMVSTLGIGKPVSEVDMAKIGQSLHQAACDLYGGWNGTALQALDARLQQANLQSSASYALGVSDSETQYNGIYAHFVLSDLVNAQWASDSGLFCLHEGARCHLDFHYAKQPVSLVHLQEIFPAPGVSR